MSTIILPVPAMKMLKLTRSTQIFNRPLLPSHLPRTVLQTPGISIACHRKPLICSSIPAGGATGANGPDLQPPLDTIFRIFTAARSVQYLRAVTGELPRRFMPVMATMDGKHAMTMIVILLGLMTKNIQLLIKPNSNNGVDLGFMFTVVWQKTFTPFGKGISFFTGHLYEAKFFIRNVETLKKPLENLSQKLSDISTPVLNKISNWTTTGDGQNKSAFMYCLITVTILVTLYIIFPKKL